jgi:hypothetical protein
MKSTYQNAAKIEQVNSAQQATGERHEATVSIIDR